MFETATDGAGDGFFPWGELADEADFFAVCIAADEAVYDGGFAGFGVGKVGAYGVDFDVFLVLGGEEGFVDVGALHAGVVQRRVKFRGFVSDL